MHTKECLAKAMICAVENMRDSADSDFDFRIMAQENKSLEWADGYLSDGTATCYCPATLERITELLDSNPWD